jgi:hypothetical protein
MTPETVSNPWMQYMAMKERTVVKKLAEKLRERNQNFPRDHGQHLGNILTHVNPAKSPEVNSFLEIRMEI